MNMCPREERVGGLCYASSAHSVAMCFVCTYAHAVILVF